MHYVWSNRLFAQNDLTTADGKRLQIINPGIHNNGAGPDFFNATVIIDGQTWAGNIELHVNASDWHRHRHTDDPAYQTVILHVVDNNDMAIYRHNGELIPQFVMKCNPALNASFHSLADFSAETISCAPAIRKMPRIYMTDWLTALGYERLYSKAERIGQLVADNAGDWTEAAFITFARALGFGTNSEPFERLARATPLRILRRHADDPLIVESILLGQAGLLGPERCSERNVERMATEYAFFATKFGISAPSGMGWKFSRMRPQGSPVRRIIYLASLICERQDFITRILSIGNTAEVVEIIGNTCAGDTALSKASIDILTINAVIPAAYAYATYKGDYSRAHDIAEMLHAVKPESNRITAMFSAAGIDITSAFISQAVIQLRKEYCEKRKCLYCRIGHRYLAGCAIR